LHENLALDLVKEIRHEQPRLGGKKLYVKLKPDLRNMGVTAGRDWLLALLARQGLTIRKPRRRPITTDSRGWWRQYPDLCRELIPIKINQLWVADITYVRITSGFAYLSLLTDAYSRQIVGYALRPDLALEGPLAALQMALRSCQPPAGLIHHSDRGSQYRAEGYVKLLQAQGATISMTQRGNPRDNAIAERVNGIIKNELMANYKPGTLSQAKWAIEVAISLYNHKRPHMSLGMQTPNQRAQAPPLTEKLPPSPTNLSPNSITSIIKTL
jgi:putative transposase